MVICKPDNTLTSSFPFSSKPPKLCIFEKIYFSAPQGELNGRSIQMDREAMGRILAREHPVEADAVIGVPDSGMPAAEGFALESGIAKVTGLVKNRYFGRTFIAPDQVSREAAVRRKLEVIKAKVYQKRLAVVDDSIIRGTTTQALVRILREEGAAEVHLRISSPPYRWPCFYGMDTRRRGELIANVITDKAELENFFGVDSLEYLSIEGLREAVGDTVRLNGRKLSTGKFCLACMDGNYPTDLPDNIKDELYPDRKK
jgi:amidophosphoribosyltransferase